MDGRLIMNIAYIRLTCWGLAINGEHYYAEVYHEDDKHDVELVLTKKYAAVLEKKDGIQGAYEAGETTLRFPSEGPAIKASIKWIRANWPKVVVIVVGSNVYTQPQKVAWAKDSSLGQILMGLYQRVEALGEDPWERANAQMLQLCTEWDTHLEAKA